MSDLRAPALERLWPSLLLAAACVGIALAPSVPVRPWPALAAAVFGFAFSLLARGTRRLALVAVALVALGLAWGELRTAALDRSILAERLGETASARVVVTGPSQTLPHVTRAPGLITRFGADELEERVLLLLPAGRAPPQGAILEMRAQPVEPRGPETGFDERGWLARRGVHVVLRGWESRVVGRRGGIGGGADRLRAHLEDAVATGTTGERERLLAGIVLGESAGLGRPLRDAFEASGLAHLLAVSGQNVAIVAVGTVAAARLVGIGRLVAEALAIAAVLGYALAAGWQPSVVRAAVAGILVSLAWLTSRPRDRWHAMAVGAFVLLVWMPTSALEPGFQLSFAAVAAIFVLMPRFQATLGRYPVPRAVAGLAAIALACGLVTAPIVWLHFGAIPLWTVPANVLAEPAMPPLVALSLLAAAVEPVLPSVAASLSWLAGWCAAWIALVARTVASLPYAEVRSGVAIAGLAATVAALWGMARCPRRWRAAVVTAVAAAAATALVVGLALRDRPAWTPPAGLRITVLDVGQGDAILLETRNGAVLVDQGPPEARVAAQLSAMGVRSLSAVVLTHPQRDHIGGAEEVLRQLDAASVLDPGLAMPSSWGTAALEAARMRSVRVVEARAGTSFRLGDLVLEVLWPDGSGQPTDDPNHWATVILARYGDVEALLPADAESDVTLRLRLPIVEILKVAHHGSADPGLPELLRRIRPRVAVISAGVGNDYGHPRSETLEALEAVPGLRTYRTDLDGRVVIETDGRTVTVSPER